MSADLELCFVLGALTFCAAFVIGVVILSSASLTYRQLARFKLHHGKRLGRLAVHMIVCGMVIVSAIIVLLVITLLPSANGSFAGFYGFRCWVASVVNISANAVVWFVLRFRKWKEKGDYYKREDSTTASTSLSSVPDTGSVASTETRGEPPPGGMEAEFEQCKVTL